MDGHSGARGDHQNRQGNKMLRALEDNLACFVAVARSGSFTEAAKQLRISQPAVSMRIREFERHCGFTLLDRTTRSVALTPTGMVLLPSAESFLEKAAHIEALIGSLNGQSSKMLRMDAASILDHIRYTILERVDSHYAGIEWAFETSYFPEEKIRRILSHSVDLAIIWGSFPQKDIRHIQLRRSSLGLAVRSDSALASNAEICPSDLTGMTVAVAPRETDVQTHERSVSYLQSGGAKIKSALDYSREGLLMTPAITATPTVVCADLFSSGVSDSGIVFRPFKDGPTVDFHLISHREPQSPMTAVIWQDLEEFFASEEGSRSLA